MVSPIRTIGTQIIKCVFHPGEPDLACGVKEGSQSDKRPSTQQNCACYAGYPRTLKRTTQKGDPDCASILFGIIRHCEHFHPFPEKSTASITCTFASFASQNCHLLIMQPVYSRPLPGEIFFLRGGAGCTQAIDHATIFLALDQCYRHFDVTKSMCCLLTVL